MSLRQRSKHFTLDYSHPLAQGLVFAGLGGYPGSVKYRDSSASDNHGTLTNMNPPTDWVWVDELGRWATFHDGSTHVIQTETINHNIEGGDWSLGIFANIARTDITQGAISLNTYNPTINLNATRWYVYFDGGGRNFNTVPVIDSWHHVMAVHQANVLYFYYDGTPDATTFATSTITFPNSPLTIGKDRTGGSAYEFAGFLSDPVFYSRALSLPEIQQLADPSNVMLSGLILPPKRKLSAIRNTLYSRRYFSLQTPIGTFVLQT